MKISDSRRVWILKLLLFAQIVLLSVFVYRAIGDGKYFLGHDDEVINYCSAKLYQATGSARAEGCIAEDVSPIGQMNWYGPGYSVIYGSLRSVFGDSSTSFIQMNVAFALLILVLIYFLPGTSENKLLTTIALVFTWQFSGYLFTYFPETLNLLMAFILILVLVKMVHLGESGKKQYWVLTYFTLVMVFMLCRVTIVFWLAALMGLSTSRKEFIRMFLVFAVGVCVALIYMKLFTAPAYVGDMHKIDRLFEFDIVQFVLRTGWSILRNTWNLVISKSIEIYFLLGLIGFTAITWWKTRERFLLAALIVSAVVVTALLAFYYPGPWYFIKQSDPLIPLLLVALMFSSLLTRLKYGIVIVALITFAINFKDLDDTIQLRRSYFTHLETFSGFNTSLQQVAEAMDETHPITVLWCYNEYPFGSLTEALLPFSNRHHMPILYTTNIVDPAEAPARKFQRHHKLQIDYILSRLPLPWTSLEEVHSTEFYHLYKIIDNKK